MSQEDCQVDRAWEERIDGAGHTKQIGQTRRLCRVEHNVQSYNLIKQLEGKGETNCEAQDWSILQMGSLPAQQAPSRPTS